MIFWSVSLISAAVLAFFGVAAIRRYTQRNQILDIPNERSSHTQPTPRGGGLAIVGVTLLGLLLHLAVNPPFVATRPFCGFFVGAMLIALVSWIDDLRSLPHRLRFGIHALAANLVILTVGTFDVVALPFLGHLELAWAGIPITFLWIVGLTNIYNFMDGIDGLAGSQAVTAGLGWAVLGWINADPLVAHLGALLAITSLSFLWHNWPPARIFMGDVGSAFLGFAFATVALLPKQANAQLAVSGILLLWPFLFDATYTLLQRLRRGENIFAAHRSHLYQRLVIVGYSHRSVTLLYTGLATIGMILAYSFAIGYPLAHWLIVIGLPTLFIALVTFVNVQEVHLRTSRSPQL